MGVTRRLWRHRENVNTAAAGGHAAGAVVSPARVLSGVDGALPCICTSEKCESASYKYQCVSLCGRRCV